MVIQDSRLDPAEIGSMLEWASSKLLALGVSSPAPRGPHSAWPTYTADAIAAYGYTGEKLRAPTPRAVEIALMDEILLLPGLIPDVKVRRIVNARSLVTPVSNRHVYSWPKIALMVHADRKSVARLYYNGLCAIAQMLTPEKAYALRHSFTSLAS